MESVYLSKNLTLQEAITSQTATRLGIDNTPTPTIIENLKAVAGQVQKIRDHFGKPIRISSGYRSPRLNKAVGGAKNSQHKTGEAMDIQGTNGLTNRQIFEYAKENLDYDQLINEYPDKKGNPSWVHISYKANGKNRRQILTIK